MGDHKVVETLSTDTVLYCPATVWADCAQNSN